MSLFGEGRITSEIHRGQEWFVVLFMDRDALGKETELVIVRCIDEKHAKAVQKRYSDAINESVRMLAPIKFTAQGARSTRRKVGEIFTAHHNKTSSSFSEVSSEEPLVK